MMELSATYSQSLRRLGLSQNGSSISCLWESNFSKAVLVSSCTKNDRVDCGELWNMTSKHLKY